MCCVLHVKCWEKQDRQGTLHHPQPLAPTYSHRSLSATPEEVNNQRDESEWEEEDINFDPLIIYLQIIKVNNGK